MGRYSIVELIGLGGMGAVYHAQHDFSKEVKCALKILKPDLADTYPEMANDFIEEARRTAGLNHPGIVKVFYIDIDEEQNLPFFVMEWLDGHTLDDELKERGRMSLDRVAELLEETCQAIHYAHEEGLVHRDLKPGNIMLVKDRQGQERVKVLDFGIAKALDSTQDAANSRVVGAPYYASPEQLNVGRTIDRRSDVYSLGVMVYQLLTGELPFDADSIGAVVNQHLTQSPPPLHSVLPEIPVGVEQVVLRALMKRPEERYGDTLEFASAFRQAAGRETGSLALSVVDAQTRVEVGKASIYLDKRYVGSTDAQGRFRTAGLNPNRYLLKVEAQQYQPREEVVSINPDQELEIIWELDRLSVGELALKTNVANTPVFLNGKMTGKSDVAGGLYLRDVTPGIVTVEIRRRNYKPFTGEVEVLPGQATPLEIELEKEPRRKSVLYIVVVALMLVSGVLAVAAIRGLSGDEDAASLHTSLSAEPREAEKHKRRGDALLAVGDFQGAVGAYRDAARLVTANAEYHYLLGEALCYQPDKQALCDDPDKQKEAGRAYYEAAFLNPVDAKYHYKLGEYFLAIKEYRCAEYEYQKAIDLGPDKAEYHFGKGKLFYNWWKFPDAAAEYDKARRIEVDEKKKAKYAGAYESAKGLAGDRPRTGTFSEPPCKPN